MAKKGKEATPNSNSVPNKDIIQRMNFLYQASTYLSGLDGKSTARKHDTANLRWLREERYTKAEPGGGSGPAEGVAGKSTPAKAPPKRKTTVQDLSQKYVKSMKTIGLKTNTRMDPSVKRTLCKGCSTLLIPGVTAKVRTKPLPSHGHAVSYTCMTCSFCRRIPANPKADEEPDPSETGPSTSVQQ